MGFNAKATVKVTELRQCVKEEIAEGRSDNDFWRSLDAARTNRAGVVREGGLDVDGGGESLRRRDDELSSANASSPPSVMRT